MMMYCVVSITLVVAVVVVIAVNIVVVSCVLGCFVGVGSLFLLLKPRFKFRMYLTTNQPNQEQDIYKKTVE